MYQACITRPVKTLNSEPFSIASHASASSQSTLFSFLTDHCPSAKQGINICTKAHALMSSFQELIEQYGYSFHTVEFIF